MKNPISHARLAALSHRLGLGLKLVDLDDMLSMAHLLQDDDFKALSDLCTTLPDERLIALSQHPDFGRVLARFIDVSGLPRSLARSFLRAGIPVRRFTLPEAVRERLDVSLVILDGILYVGENSGREHVPVDITGCTVADFLRLRRYAQEAS